MSKTTATKEQEYYRRDQRTAVSAPDLSKDCTFAEHIVHARGKRTRFTSVSLDLSKIKDFGDTDYRFARVQADDDGHELIEHERLIKELRSTAGTETKADRLRAIQAIRYATKRREGLVSWSFAITKIARKDLITWAGKQIQPYFHRIK